MRLLGRTLGQFEVIDVDTSRDPVRVVGVRQLNDPPQVSRLVVLVDDEMTCGGPLLELLDCGDGSCVEVDAETLLQMTGLDWLSGVTHFITPLGRKMVPIYRKYWYYLCQALVGWNFSCY